MDRRAALRGALTLAWLAASRGARAEEPAQPLEDSSSADALAQWLAGIRPTAARAPSGEWLAYAHVEDARWRREAARVAAMRRWSARELGARLSRDSAVLYPFAGADALHALALFGRAGHIQLVGLEPVGEAPELLAPPPPGYFGHLSDALGELHRLTFSRTREMSRDFSTLGVLPALLSTLARLGGRVTQVARTHPPDAVTIDWVAQDGQPRRLEYARVDLSNDGLAREASFFAGLRRRLAPHATFVKASSYLLADPSFSHLRQALLEDTELLVQDDSGLPYRSLASRWSVRLYGTYTRPASPFRDRVQPDLAAAYATGPACALPFGMGYFTQPERSNLLVATKVAS